VRECVFTRPRRESPSSWERLSRGRAKIASDRAPECEIKLGALRSPVSLHRSGFTCTHRAYCYALFRHTSLRSFRVSSLAHPAFLQTIVRDICLQQRGPLSASRLVKHSRYLPANFQERPFQLGEINERRIFPSRIIYVQDAIKDPVNLPPSLSLYSYKTIYEYAPRRALIGTRATLPRFEISFRAVLLSRPSRAGRGLKRGRRSLCRAADMSACTAYSSGQVAAPEGIYVFDVSHSGHREPDSNSHLHSLSLSLSLCFSPLRAVLPYIVRAEGGRAGQIARKE